MFHDEECLSCSNGKALQLRSQLKMCKESSQSSDKYDIYYGYDSLPFSGMQNRNRAGPPRFSHVNLVNFDSCKV